MIQKQLILGVLFFAGSVAISYGQSDIKEWKKKLKKLTPQEYKELVEENNSLQMQVSEAQNDADHYRSESQAKDAEIAKLRQELEGSKGGSIAASPASQTTGSSSKPGKIKAGIVYKVQIGAFRNKDLGKYVDNHENFSGDVDSDGTRKYTLGEFVDYWEANRFKKYLREMGVKDAWIVSYKDGKRVPIKDALEGVL